MASPYDQDDDDDYAAIQSGRLDANALIPANQPPAPTSIPAPQPAYTPPAPAAAPENPVIRNFDTSAAASTNTVPAAATPPPAETPDQTPAGTPDQNNSRLVAQYHADQAGALRYHKSQGGDTEILPTGAEVPKTDQDGNHLFKPATVQPFTRLDDGQAYSVQRDQYGNQKYNRILDGQEGKDYHTDPQTGDQFVVNQGQRESIGQNPLIPQINQGHAQIEQYRQQSTQSDIDIAHAENGVQGQGPIRAASLSDLRQEVTGIDGDVKKLNRQITDLGTYTPDDAGAADPNDITEKKGLQDQLAQKAQRRAELQKEIDARDSVIGDARQQRDTTRQSMLDLSSHVGTLQAVNKMGGVENVAADLHTIVNGGAIPQDRAQSLASIGLLSQEPTQDGQGTMMKATSTALPFLDDATKQALASDPSRFVLSQGVTAGHVQQAAAGQIPTDDNGTPPPTTNQPARNYQIGDDGQVNFVPGKLSAGITDAFNDGHLTKEQYDALLPKAALAEKAIEEQQKIAQENPAAWKAFVSGAGKGAAFTVGAGPGAGLGSEIGGALGLLGGPFAEATVPIGSFVGGLAGGYIGGSIASKGYEAVLDKLGQYSQTIKSFQDASALHPNYDAAGNIASFAAGIPRGLAKAAGSLIEGDAGVAAKAAGGALGSGAADADAAGARVADVADTIAGTPSKTAIGQLLEQLQSIKATRAAGGNVAAAAAKITPETLVSGLKDTFSVPNLRKAVGQAVAGGGGVKETAQGFATMAREMANGGASVPQIAKAIGLSTAKGAAGMVLIDAATKAITGQDQSVQGSAQAAIIGALMSGHGIDAPGVRNEDIATAVLKAKVRRDAGVAFDQPLHPSQAPEGMDTAQFQSVAAPMTARDTVLAGAFEDSIRKQAAAGKPLTNFDDLLARLKGATGGEVQQHGKSIFTGVKAGEPESTLPPTQADVPPQDGSPATSETPTQPLVSGPESKNPSASNSSESPEEPVPTPAKAGTPPAIPASEGGVPSVKDSSAQHSKSEAPLAQGPETRPETLQGSQQEEGKKGPSAQDSTAFKPIADRVNAGQRTEAEGTPPSVAFQALTRIRKLTGADVSPDVAREVSGKVQAIMDDPKADKQASVKALVASYKPQAPDSSAPADSPAPAPEAPDRQPPPVAKGETPKSPAAKAEGSQAPEKTNIGSLLGSKDGTHDVIEFHTSKGTEYTVDAMGHTTRLNRAPGEAAPTYKATMPAAFVTPEDRTALAAAEKAGGRLVMGEKQPDGTFTKLEPDSSTDLRGRPVSVAVLDRTTNEPMHIAPATTTPAVGMHPVEMRYEGGQKWNHIGDAITKITKAGEKRSQGDGGPQKEGPDAAEQGRAWVVRFQDGKGTSFFKTRGEADAFAGSDADLHAQPPVYDFKPAHRTYAEDGKGFKPLAKADKADLPDAPERVASKGAPTSVQGSIDENAPVPQKAPSQPPAKEVASSANDSTKVSNDTSSASEKRGSTQLTLKPEQAKPFQAFARSIPESDIYSQKDASGKEQYGRETESHVTALYGLTGGGDDAAAVGKAVAGYGPVKFKVGKLSVFSNPDAPYDVLKADVESSALHGLNGDLRKLEHKSDFPDYHPHLTIAYLKKGAGAKYVGKQPYGKQEITLDTLTHSSADRVKTDLSMTSANPVNKSGLTKQGETPAKVNQGPITPADAVATAKRIYGQNQGFLNRQGIRSAKFDAKVGKSGIQVVGNRLEIDPQTLAGHLTKIQANQAALGLPHTVEDAFQSALVEEGIHGLQYQLAKEAGHGTIEEHYSDANLPTEALPADWEDTGRQLYQGWDQLPAWQKKAEYVRMRVQYEMTGQVSEALYQRVDGIVARLDELAKGNGTHSKLQDYIDRLKAAHAASTAVAQPAKRPRRSFELGDAGLGGAEDVLDHIKTQRGMKAPDGSPEFNGAPKLGGVYHHTVYGGKMTPDDMAKELRDVHGVGDGTPDTMWNEISRAVQNRQTLRATKKAADLVERQTTAFDKATDAPGKGKEAVNSRDLAIGQTVKIGDQSLKVIKIDADENVTLEDHTKFGVQKIHDGRVLYVESVEGGEPAETSAPSTPQLRPGEKGTGDLFQGGDQPFNLMGETGTDGEKIQAAKDRAERETAEAKAIADRDQMDFTKPKSGASKELMDSAREAFNGLFAAEAKAVIDSEPFKRWFGDSKVVDEEGSPLAVYHGTGHQFDAFNAKKALANGTTEGSTAGFFFSDNEDVATGYADRKEYAVVSRSGKQVFQAGFKTEEEARQFLDSEVGAPGARVAPHGKGPRVLPVYLSLQKPAIVDMRGEALTGWDNLPVPAGLTVRDWRNQPMPRASLNDIATSAKQAGRDGLIVRGISDSGSENHIGTRQTTYVAFRPNQIKSSTGNSGTFDPKNPSILQAAAAPEVQAGLPKERRAQFLDLADKMDAEGINTPEKVAQFLTDLAPDGRARKYSQALWQFIGAVDPSKAGVHDWNQVYASLDAARSTESADQSESTPESQTAPAQSPAPPKEESVSPGQPISMADRIKNAVLARPDVKNAAANSPTNLAPTIMRALREEMGKGGAEFAKENPRHFDALQSAQSRDQLVREIRNQALGYPADGWKNLGKNRDGSEVHEAPNGVRSFVDGGIRVTQDIGVVPGKGSGPLHTLSEQYQIGQHNFLTTQEHDAFDAAKAVAPATAPVVQNDYQTAGSKVADWVRQKLDAGQKFSLQELYNEADKHFGGTQAQGKYTFKDATDALELAVNRQILTRGAKLAEMSAADAVKEIAHYNALLDLLPTQGRQRNEEMEGFQQFSTPPQLAFAANWVAAPRAGDVHLEPSAGIGGLASFGKAAGAQVVVNELSTRRLQLLKALPFDRFFNENAEQLHNILPADVKPTVVVMNPPFSQNAGRTGGKTDLMTGARHLETALKRLEPGGRLVAIVGRGMSMEAPTFKDWWKRIGAANRVRANIEVSGEEYAKYGTKFDNRILVIDKAAPVAGDSIIGGRVEKVADLPAMLEAIRNERSAIAADQPTGDPSPTPSGTRPVAGSAGGDSSVAAVTRPRGGRKAGSKSGVEATGGNGSPGVAGPQAGIGAEASGPGEPRPPAVIGSQEPAGLRGGTSGATADGGAGGPGQPGSRGSVLTPAAVDAPEVSTHERTASEADDAAIFDTYQPTVKVAGAKPHPAPLAESSAMASIRPPATTYRPQIDKSLIEEGRLSDAQLENITLAGQSHMQTLPNGARQGFFIGDGTGVGKGREIAGIFMDNANQGRKKGLWISYNGSLFPDAQRDLAGIGTDKNILIDHSKTKAGEDIASKDGILFSTYSTLAKTGKSKEGQAGGSPSRLDQIVKWLGPDFDGVIAFDEAHLMGNAVQVKAARGVKKPSQRALAGVELQAKLPKARVVYVSATGATEVSNLSYAERLGLWGPGTAFEGGKAPFISSIDGAGVAAMEMVARDLKAMGLYMARSISYHGVGYEKLEHQLTPEQIEVYDELAGGWQHVLNNMEEALKITEQKDDGNAVSQAKSQFWGTHQRFFNQVMTAMQMPSVIESLEKDLANGHAPVIQLTNTNEAALQRILAEKSAEAQETGADLDLETLDFTPRQALMDYIERGFPTQQYEHYTDEEGNERTRPAKDSQGNPIQNAEAVAMREALLNKLADVRVPENPLDIIINHFGPDNVSEVTGRTRRVVRRRDKGGQERMVAEPWGKAKAEADADDFQSDKKKILVFSAAGGTGKSYHADLSAKNQRMRQHYILQAGWRADSAIQGLGRSHRSNQAQPPNYRLASTNLNAQKRFVSTIARRMESLGALTKGSRESSSQGIFNAADNLETEYSTDAIQSLYRDIFKGHVEGVSVDDFAQQMGLKMKDERGNFNQELEPSVKTFLNRMLNLKVDAQNKVFDAFFERLTDRLDQARQRGELDTGMETIRALNAEVTQKELLNTDKKTGATTEYQRVTMKQPARVLTADQMMKKGLTHGFVQNKTSGMVWANLGTRNVTGRGGSVTPTTMLQNHKGNYSDAMPYEVGTYTGQKYKTISADEARPLIEKAIADAPKTFDEIAHMVTGALLPVWNRMQTAGGNRVQRIVLDNGERILGRRIDDKNINQLLQEFHVAQQSADVKPADIVTRLQTMGGRVRLANGTAFVQRTVYGQPRLEVQGLKVPFHQLEPLGMYSERIQYENRYFMPEDKAPAIMERLMLNNPVVEGMAEGPMQAAQAPEVSSNADEHDEPTADAGNTLGAASAPEVVKKAGARLNALGERIRAAFKGVPFHDWITSHFDAVKQLAENGKRETRTTLRGDYANALDRLAASAAIEAGGDRQALEADLAKVRSSHSPSLAAKLGPVWEYALEHFDRLEAASANQRAITDREYEAAKAVGKDLGKRKNYVPHFYKGEAPDVQNVPTDTTRGVRAAHRSHLESREFPTLADAVNAGMEPEMDIADITAEHVFNNQMVVGQAKFLKALTIQTLGDKPIIAGLRELTSKELEDGTVVHDDKVPGGYKAVDAGGRVLTVLKEVAPLFEALYGTSAVRANPLTRMVWKAASAAKSYTFVGDTFHGSRNATRAALGFGITKYARGLAAINYALGDLDRAVKAGEITPEIAQYVREVKPIVMEGLREGLQLTGSSDNLMKNLEKNGFFHKVPGVRELLKANEWINEKTFNHLIPSVMVQAYVIARNRNVKDNPGMPAKKAARLAAKEINEFFGNLGSQGLFVSKTMQDFAQMLGSAPMFAESMFRTEVRGAAQAGKAAWDAVRGRGLRVGNIARALGGLILSMFIANQILNLFTKGQPTWNNDDGHKLDAWIPGGAQGRGFWFSPLSIAAEYSHAMLKYLEGGESAVDAVGHIASNKLSTIARGAKDLATDHDYANRPFGSTRERLTAAAADALPLPLPLTSVINRNPKSATGFEFKPSLAGAIHQGLSMVGVKTDPEKTARAKAFQMAQPFKPAGAADHGASPYSDLRRMLDQGVINDAQAEIGRLVASGHDLRKIGAALGIGPDGAIRQELFTGGKESEKKMFASLNADQRKIYFAAQKEHAQIAQRFRQAAGRIQAAGKEASED